MKNEIVYIGNFLIGQLDAQSQLILANCKIFSELGFHTTLIGNDNELARSEDVLKNKTIVDQISCYNIKFNKTAKDLFASMIMFKHVEHVLDYIGAEKIAYVICYGSLGFAVQIDILQRWCHKRKIPLVDICADLPVMDHGSLLQRVFKKFDRAYMHWIIRKKADGLIAVSEYIKRYFAKQSDYPIITIPPLKDTQLNMLKPGRNDDLRRIVYVGVPFPIDGRKVDESAYKDRIDLFIDLLCSVTERVPACRLDIYGLTSEEYLRVVSRQRDLLEKYQDMIVFHGRIEHNAALQIVADADFTVVYRLKNKMTMAGFSTKFVESISCGTPVIMTDTSEYAHYVELGASSVMLDVDDLEQQRCALVKALNKSSEEICDMKRSCYESRVFDYRNYIEPMKAFLTAVLKQ